VATTAAGKRPACGVSTRRAAGLSSAGSDTDWPQRQGEILREAAALVEAGKRVPMVDARRFMLDTALQAHALVESDGATGQIVVDVGP
jgi:NADPH:quinone reductase-like Zn-dependent oxidoreductase